MVGELNLGSSSPGYKRGSTPAWDGWVLLTFAGLLLAPWTGLVAVVRQKEAFARDQKLSFALDAQ